MPDSRTLKFVSLHIIVATITLACILMNGPMRAGLPVDNSLLERVGFIAANTGLWTASWMVWMASALGLFVFCSILASELNDSLSVRISLMIVALGIGPDLIAEVIYAFIIPQMIAQGSSLDMVQSLELIASHLTGFLGNGLYNLGGLGLTLIAWRQRVFPLWVFLWGLTSWGLGLSLSVSIALANMKAAEVFTASSMVLSTSWMLIFAYCRFAPESLRKRWITP
ncbi:hypothetical protein [Pseudoteredinibacter isoporae]|uniref:hypothetical protein n=1 Tax=Pseudoteredinibacter isoporae TaxID=570281 RepID=UPI003101B486